MVNAALPLDPTTLAAMRAFVQRLPERYAVRDCIAFGSRVRQTHRADSDADLALVLEGEPGDRFDVVREMAGLAFDVMLETGVLVQALPLWEADFEPMASGDRHPLIETVLRDGLRL